MLIGLDQFKDMLSTILKRDIHSLLLHGPDGIGKFSLAVELVKEILTYDSVNMHIIKAEEGKSVISVDQIRELFELINIVPYVDKKHYIIIDNAEQMNSVAFNMLLKRLEEPKQTELFILVTSHLEKVSSTISSRCLIFNMQIDNAVLNEYLGSDVIENDVIKHALFNKGFASVLDYTNNNTTRTRYHDCYTFIATLLKDSNLKNLGAYTTKFISNLDINLELLLIMSGCPDVNVDQKTVHDIYDLIKDNYSSLDVNVDILIYKILMSNAQ